MKRIYYDPNAPTQQEYIPARGDFQT